MTPEFHRLAADAILVVHFTFIAFVVVGQLFILTGGIAGWKWVRNRWFRAAHLFAIGIVVIQAWIGVICPLTTWEQWLRDQAGDPTYDETFVAHWLRKFVFFEAPPWVFTVAYTAFALLVIASWIFIRPRPFHISAKRPRR
ncbi:MAG: DUF2784 domain-containing protein [Verrucomicrobiota bacterium]